MQNFRICPSARMTYILKIRGAYTQYSMRSGKQVWLDPRAHLKTNQMKTIAGGLAHDMLHDRRFYSYIQKSTMILWSHYKVCVPDKLPARMLTNS
jgi:hypothetical protein